MNKVCDEFPSVSVLKICITIELWKYRKSVQCFRNWLLSYIFGCNAYSIHIDLLACFPWVVFKMKKKFLKNVWNSLKNKMEGIGSKGKYFVGKPNVCFKSYFVHVCIKVNILPMFKVIFKPRECWWQFETWYWINSTMFTRKLTFDTLLRKL